MYWLCNLPEMHVSGKFNTFPFYRRVWPFSNMIGSPIDFAAHKIPSLAHSNRTDQPHAHRACVQGQGPNAV